MLKHHSDRSRCRRVTRQRLQRASLSHAVATPLMIIFFGFMLNTKPVEANNLGHRMGGDIYKPENTLYCYEKALKNLQDNPNFLYVELDVQETKDGKIVVFHDTDSIKRLVPKSSHNRTILKDTLRKAEFDEVRIRDLTLSQITKLSLAKNARIPSLENVLRASLRWKLRKPMLIEIKSLRSDRCRNNLIELVSQFHGRLDVNFLAFHANFNRSFPDPLRWKPLFKRKGLKVYTAKKPKTDAFDLTGDVTEDAVNWHFTPVLTEESFVVRDEESRTLRLPIRLPQTITQDCALRIGVYHGYDDSGDKGLKFRLIDTEGNELINGFTKSKNWQWFETTLGVSKEAILFLEDHDTKFTGKYPGNGGAVKATVVSRTNNIGVKD